MGMKQAKAHRSKKCYEEEEEEVDEEASSALPDFDDSDKSSPHNKTQKTTKRKRKSHDDDDADDGSNSNSNNNNNNNNNSNNNNDNDDSSSSNRASSTTTTASRYAQKKSKKAQLKRQLQSQIPTHDPETGIPYNKIQVRRMMRRVKHGLSPIPTEEEEIEIRAREKRERMEEEALMYAERRNDNEDASKLEDADDDDNDANYSEDGGEDKNNDNDAASFSDDDDGDNNGEDDVVQKDSDEKQTTVVKTTTPPTKKAKRSKPVPSDYICQACQNKPTSPSSSSSFVPHWIYDCPAKKIQRGCNQISKKLRGLHDPPSHKVFVSGLPFECDEGMVKRFFEETMGKNDGKNNTNATAELVHCKLLKFEDSNRCKGQAFLTFDSEEGAKIAIRVMNGSIWKEIVEPGMATKGKKKNKKIMTANEGGVKKELKLKVTKALNRFVTKNKTGMGRGGR